MQKLSRGLLFCHKAPKYHIERAKQTFCISIIYFHSYCLRPKLLCDHGQYISYERIGQFITATWPWGKCKDSDLFCKFAFYFSFWIVLQWTSVRMCLSLTVRYFYAQIIPSVSGGLVVKMLSLKSQRFDSSRASLLFVILLSLYFLSTSLL